MCTTASHEALKRNPTRLHSECTFIGEQRDEGFPTLLMFNHGCGSTLATPALSGSVCEFCSREPGVGNNCCAAQWRKVRHEALRQYERDRAAQQAWFDAEAE